MVNLFASVDILATFLFAMGNKITGRAYPMEDHFAWQYIEICDREGTLEWHV